MSTRTPLSRTIARLGALLVGVVTAGLVGLPAAHATDLTVSLVLAPGQSGSIGKVVSNTDVTPVSTCDAGLSVTFDATMEGTVHVAPNATLGSYACAVDFQISGQSTGLVEQVSVDVLPGLSISDVAVQEGDTDLSHPTDSGGAIIGPKLTVVAFTLTLSVPSTVPVTVAAATADGTATAPSDYHSTSTTVTFQPGQTVALVGTLIEPDDTEELDETFTVNLSAATNAVITDAQGTCTLLNDDHSINT